MAKRAANLSWFKWSIVLTLASVLGAIAGHLRAPDRGPFGMALSLSEAETRDLEGAATLAVANATWLLGTQSQTHATTQAALEKLPAIRGAERARLLIRMAILVDNPDGHRALYSAACTADENSCERFKEIAYEESKKRAVAPGNILPPSLIPGHPPVER